MKQRKKNCQSNHNISQNHTLKNRKHITAWIQQPNENATASSPEEMLVNEIMINQILMPQ